ncbi:DUF6207 family protein [Streptomyces sp. NPDC097727]|uniref:DUF6207 family protein n=1 Tax=Streptomyces sp. NPDC097727 TaxID=3366092 RepID=UPI00382FAE96
MEASTGRCTAVWAWNRSTPADEATAHAVMTALEQQWATSGIGPVRKVPGEPGVKARMYADTRRSLPSKTSSHLGRSVVCGRGDR